MLLVEVFYCNGIVNCRFLIDNERYWKLLCNRFFIFKVKYNKRNNLGNNLLKRVFKNWDKDV